MAALAELGRLFDGLGTDYLVIDRRWPLAARRDDPAGFVAFFEPVAETSDQELFKKRSPL